MAENPSDLASGGSILRVGEVPRLEVPSRGETSPNTTPVLASSLPLPDKPSIAVLPFQNMSGDPEQEYFADGMVEEIITAPPASVGSSSSPVTRVLRTKGKPSM